MSLLSEVCQKTLSGEYNTLTESIAAVIFSLFSHFFPNVRAKIFGAFSIGFPHSRSADHLASKFTSNKPDLKNI